MILYMQINKSEHKPLVLMFSNIVNICYHIMMYQTFEQNDSGRKIAGGNICCLKALICFDIFVPPNKNKTKKQTCDC